LGARAKHVGPPAPVPPRPAPPKLTPPPPTTQALPGASQLLPIPGGTIPIASKIDDAALRADVPGLIRIPLAAGIAETVLVFQRLHAEGRLVA